jgi:hypothetical protein
MSKLVYRHSYSERRNIMQHRPMCRWFRGVAVAALVAGVGLLGIMAPVGAQVAVDTNLPTYNRVGGVSGNLNSIGSDTLNNLMTGLELFIRM